MIESAFTSGKIDFLVTGQIRRHGRKLTEVLAFLRRERMVRMSAGVMPARNTRLDPMMAELLHNRLRIESDINRLASILEGADIDHSLFGVA